ncbi:MAG TPA: hypothetical protein PKK15_06940 [Kouleothrix sp.]|nr:hypothetical protein [Kouleothrix sp.]
MPTEMTRIEHMSDAERTVIGLLTPQERKDALLEAARSKQRRVSADLMREHLDRIRRGEIAPLTHSEDGQPYPTNGRTVYYQSKNEPMEDTGRVPGHDGMHVLRKQDGTLFFSGGYHLREEGEVWDDFIDNL